ncbi:hypothetical protein MNB_SV-9-330 [hydrothermal vent metagenome]|uniref:ATPase AAA-type core domain-containing protein n=1 Tax=hydrothermal vent metagenome TaxID=652676 RepID=A0A1W1BCE9_9ZZZZ
MQLKKVEIIKYRNFENIIINFDKQDNFPNVFSIASKNGGGKSTLIQFIFIILHCFMDKNKQKYIKNLLEEFYEITEDIELVNFIIEDNGKDYYLNFSITKEKAFNMYLDEEELKKSLKKESDSNREKQQKFSKLSFLINILEEFNRLTPLFKNKFRDSENIFNELGMSSLYDELRIEGNRGKVVKDYKEFIKKALNDSRLQSVDIEDLDKYYRNTKNLLDKFRDELNNKNIIYINHINHDTVLILETDMDIELLDCLSKKVFLNAPNSQIYHFLSSDDKKEIFDSDLSYSAVLENSKNELDNFYTYNFIPTELILKSFKKASDEDLKIKRKTNKYGEKYDRLSQNLKSLLDNKEILENENGNEIIFRLKDSKIKILPEDLSHGELKKLAIFIWLKYIVSEDSIILIDEIDIAFHPRWQYQLIKDLSKWSDGSQFLLATHSPQILSSTYYKNLIILKDGEVKQLSKPLRDNDLNHIVELVMGGKSLPEELDNLQKEYRELIEEDKENSEKAEFIKEKILELEGANSSFFRRIDFYKKMNKR